MLLFERFISAERGEPPDIDIDFEHQRREEVIQYIYKKYGRHRAALTAVVVCYRPRSALRDAGRALGIDLERIEAVSKSQHWFDGRSIAPERLLENGFDPESPVCRLWVELTQQLIGFPRHLSQHPGGFVIARDTLSELVPVENAAMAGRSVIQWDKDDLDALRLTKVDILALGMLSAIRRALEFVGQKLGAPMALHQIPKEDRASYAMLSRGDSVGTFQVESRAQMAMLKTMQGEVEAAPDSQISLTDPDARSMATSGRGTGVVGYNVQTAVDAEHHLIVAHEVTNQGHDRTQLAPMALKARQATGLDALTALADRGYFSGDQVLSCEGTGIAPHVPRPLTSSGTKRGFFTRQDFSYDVERDHYTCPAGANLTKANRRADHAEDSDFYRHLSACHSCALRPQCTPTRLRRIKRWEHEAVLEKMQARLDHMPDAMKIRRQTVEHPFGTLKAWRGATHFLTRTLE